MGIVSALALMFGIAFFVSLRMFLKTIAKDESDEDENLAWALVWGSRLAGLVALLGVLGLIDGYIRPIPSPFQAPEADLPERSEPSRRPPPKIKTPSKRDPMQDAKSYHKDAMNEFDQSNGVR